VTKRVEMVRVGFMVPPGLERAVRLEEEDTPWGGGRSRRFGAPAQSGSPVLNNATPATIITAEIATGSQTGWYHQGPGGMRKSTSMVTRLGGQRSMA
jgi:hypothetical protein